MVCQSFGSRALLGAPSTGACGVGDYPAPDLSRRASASRSTPEKSVQFGPDGTPSPSEPGRGSLHEVHGEAGPGSSEGRLHLGAPGHGRARRGLEFVEGDCVNNEPRPPPRPRPGAENTFRADLPGEALGRGVGVVRRARCLTKLRGAPRAAAVRREALGVVPAGRVRGISFEATTRVLQSRARKESFETY